MCWGGGGGIRGKLPGGQLEGNYPLKYLLQTSLRGGGGGGERESKREGRCWLHLRRYWFVCVGVGSFVTILVRLGRCWLLWGRCWFVWVGVGCLGRCWLHLGVDVGSFGSVLASFGSVLASFGSVLASFGSVLVRLGR